VWLVILMVRTRREVGPVVPGNAGAADPETAAATAGTMSTER
jgi:hypothetical protein